MSPDASSPGYPGLGRNIFAPPSPSSATGADAARAAESLRPFYRWGWGPLVLGCVALAGLCALAAESLLDALHPAPTGSFLRIYLLGWFTFVTVLLAVWVGGYVWYSRWRIENVREALRAQQASLAEQAWRAEQAIGLGALARALAHDVRGPLHAIGLQAEFLRRTAARLPPEARPAVERIGAALREETERLDALLHGYQSQSGGQQALDVRPVPLAPLVQRAVASRATALWRAGVEVRVRLSPTLPELPADPVRLEQALLGLVRHAQETVPAGGRLELEGDHANGDIVLRATYDGRGTEEPEALLRPFYQPGSGASGLGLAIARDVVRAHGGHIQAAAAPARKGVCITLRLPLASPVADEGPEVLAT